MYKVEGHVTEEVRASFNTLFGASDRSVSAVMLKSLARIVNGGVRLATVSASRVLAPAGRSELNLTKLATVRPFTRSLWMMSKNGGGHRPGFLNSNQHIQPVSCGCGGLHTEGDKAFAEFLSDEIKEEKKIQKSKSLPAMSGGWEVELNGTEAKLIRKTGGETVTVTFNVNNSIPPNFEEEPEEGQKPSENEPEIVSTPNFVVEVTKQDAKHSLVFDCHYPEDETGRGEEEEDGDIFAIREVSFQPAGDDDWKETSYTLNTDSLDWALYDHLMDFLAERRVDNTFAEELMELSTALEHQEYIKFLEDLKSFIKCQ
ncbi:complement component 1 Q subcomponent-binding protein, mitochondrial isoform X2 [Brienomyrus brachyistius]|uniref:complement component 1 Q subcomponent-binding protein, mitochondrial isoform X2 n=1 Tax=Brienomyrus brachyistius TaxID=42636 RepID=UPI0020B1F39F|nr:complement component 1 Q subcomponent-binding protein, mitochondrial isoform X2 [Brienomyrus brachyistius]